MSKDSLVAMTPPNPKIQFYLDAFLSRNSKEKLREEFFDCNGRKKKQNCNSLWNKDIAEICDRELQLLAKSSLSIVSKARIEIIGASSNDGVNEDSHFGSMPVSANTLNKLRTVKTPFDRDFQGCKSGNSSLHFAPKALNRQFSPCVLVGEWCTRLEDENGFKSISKVSDLRKKEESDHFTCPVCLLKIPRDGAGGSHLEFELIELKNLSKTSIFKVTPRHSMNFLSLVTWHDGDDQNEESNCNIEGKEINVYADTQPEGDERMNSSALRYKEFVQVRKNRRCRLVDWQKTKRRRDIGDIITGIQKDTSGHVQHPLSVDLDRLGRASNFFAREADDDDGDNRPMGKRWQIRKKSGHEIKYPYDIADDQEENIDVEM